MKKILFYIQKYQIKIALQNIVKYLQLLMIVLLLSGIIFAFTRRKFNQKIWK